MNRISVWNDLLRSPRGAAGEPDDFALARRMRALAVELRIGGRARLRLSQAGLRAARGVCREAESMRRRCADGGAALERLAQDARLMESCAAQARLDGVRGLPASDGRARIGRVLDALCGAGDLRLTRDRLLLALASFDDVQPLLMAELWAVPEAMRIALTRAWLGAAEIALGIARERELAERWANGAAVGLRGRGPAFYEHALRLLAEREDAPRRAALERALAEMDCTPEQAVRRAHEQSSVALMRLDNILANKRLIDALRWQDCFAELSAVETELNYDPAGVYPAMEDDSRDAVRAQVAVIARKLGLSEITVARCAVSAAQRACDAAGAHGAKNSAAYEMPGAQSTKDSAAREMTSTQSAKDSAALDAADSNVMENPSSVEKSSAQRMENPTSQETAGVQWTENFAAREAAKSAEGDEWKDADTSENASHLQTSVLNGGGSRTENPSFSSGAADGGAPGDPARRTVCYWLYDDAGRRALAQAMSGKAANLPKMTPDPTGRRAALGIAILAALAYALYLKAVPGLLFAPLGLPLAWCAATALLGKFHPKFVRPAKLLKLKVDSVPDEWRTLVVMPVLLSSPRRAEEICDQIEALSCLEPDENLQYLILGDFADGDALHAPGDAEILERTRQRVREINARAGRERCFYLHRERQLLEADRRWMGRDRKRGALSDLNRLLLGQPGAEAAFDAEGAACRSLRGKFRFVLTIDADTRFLPGEARRLIGTLAHPLNAPRRVPAAAAENPLGKSAPGAAAQPVRRGYAVLQPQMEMAASACANDFVRLFAGNGGLNTYPTSVSNFWQDVTGEGIFGGKGLYDVRAFSAALDGALPEGRILSHDLIEGTLAKAALVSDVCFYDGFPATLGSWLKRLNRWTRGDWQLLPVLLGAKRYPPDGQRLGAAARVRLLDNLLRSLRAPALLALLIQAVWFSSESALFAAMLFAFLTPILYPRGGHPWRRATVELAILPATASCALDAILRTLWRLAFTGRHLLDWVTSADADAAPNKRLQSGRAAAILLLPGLLSPRWALAAAALAAMFAVGAEWVRDLEESRREDTKAVPESQTALLTGLARDIWRFFESNVGADQNFLPPDNVQIDPPVGAARRTSPTNIGLYLMSCAAARELGFLSADAARSRMAQTTGVLERLEKWRGHLYNWYDIDALAPLCPKYVSSVDSGNLAAALLLCAEMVVDEDPALAGRMRALARGMDFSALYDAERDLFRIGADVEHGRLSDAHYDLLASESRILSYVAIMLGGAPVRHWAKLSRAAVATPDGTALASWSGTMFEYLMPELILRAPSNALLGASARTAIEAQRALGEARNRPWGVSESGYFAFDLHLNYQYRAFGLRELALSDGAPEDVVAPYASLLALFAEPEAVAENIRAMQAAGWRGEYGLYEAADYLRAESGGAPKLVRSFMAHHQGMALCALCNALTGDALCRAFLRIPEARALQLLLEERPIAALRLRRLPPVGRNASRGEAGRRDDRMARPDLRLVDAHLLSGAGATVLVTADGAAHYQRGGLLGTRFSGDFLNRTDGACVHLRLDRTGECAVFGQEATSAAAARAARAHAAPQPCRTVYSPGGAAITCSLGPVRCELKLCVSPEDGALIKRVRLSNDSSVAETVRVADCAPVALGTQAEMLSHPAFRQLFIESERIAQCAVALKSRPRSPEERRLAIVHLVSTPGSISCQTDFERLVGRTGSTQRPGDIRWDMDGTVGAVLNPCSAMQTAVTVGAGETATLHFAFGLVEEDEIPRWIARNFAESAAERASQLAAMQARAMLGFLGLSARDYPLLDRLSAMMFDAHLRAPDARGEAAAPCDRRALWPLGISGDLPVLAVHVHRKEDLPRVREAIRAHEFYRAMGLSVDLVLVNEHGNDYDQPVRDALSDAIAYSHLNELRGTPGGVHLPEGRALTAVQRDALHRAAFAEIDAGADFSAQLRRTLSALDAPRAEVRRMDLGENRLEPMLGGNGYGAFLSDGRYAIDVHPGRPTPAAWANLLANDRFGALLTERGGGFLWCNNSRDGRLTAFHNDALCEGWGFMLYLMNADGTFVPLLPGAQPATPFRAIYSAAETVYRFEAERLSGEVALCVRPDAPEMRLRATLRSPEGGDCRLVGFVDWLMGADARDAAFLRTWSSDGACFAAGASADVGYFAAASARASAGPGRSDFLGRGSILAPEGIARCTGRSGGWVLDVPVRMQPDTPLRTDWAIGWARDSSEAVARVRAFYARPDYEPVRESAHAEWNALRSRLTVETPDPALNQMANGWLLHQVLASRVRGRTGLYQPGGAFGFRDQLQDMLALLPFDPARVRAHLLYCAARQFEDGDAMHWWHDPFLGVRTNIRDDVLFLPYVTARYVRWTEDMGVLGERIPYLKNVEIEPGKEDRFCEMQPGEESGTLHDHCMRAFRRAAQTGEHGLALMGGGDWNDGMNRVGAEGRGESVWLTEFLIACATEYARIAPDESDAAWLSSLADRLMAAVEAHGWDGRWYLRAYADDGSPLGSALSPACQIDAISQAWAVLAGLDEERCAQAMDAAWQRLADERTGIIRLLAPPFPPNGMDPGYIRGYPEGVRENGAQYTHAACWVALALIQMGDAARAHRAISMLLPPNHANSPEAAARYRVEPYVVAADVYDGVHAGRGGWTWYTGSAAWLYTCILALLGFERRGGRVRLCALLGDWPEAAVTVRFGRSSYRLICRAGAQETSLDGTAIPGSWIKLRDDGCAHEAVFPPRADRPAAREPARHSQLEAR